MSFNWQEHFPMLSQRMNDKRLAYLDSAATALKPQSVVDAMTEYMTTHTSSIHRGIYKLSEENTTRCEQVRDQVKRFINARTREEVIFTRGTTESINLVAQAWGIDNLKKDDEILISHLEHHANIVPWQMIAKRTGAIIKVIGLKPDGSLDPESFARELTSRTRLLALTMVSNTLGVITEAKQLAAKARAVGARVLLDAAQAAPHFPLDVQDLGCDFLTLSAHKIYGPTGVGILWGRVELLDAMSPWMGGGNMISTVTFEATTWNKLPEKFEAGTPPIAEILGFGEALEFIKTVGWSEIQSKDHFLREEVTKALSDVPGIKVFGTTKQKIATFAFNLEGVHSQDLGSVLDKEGVAIRTGHHCTQPLMKFFGVTSMARASFGPYNTLEDIQQLVGGIEKARQLFL